MYIVMGDDFALNCSYRANPAVSARVVWYKNGRQVSCDWRRAGHVTTVLTSHWSRQLEFREIAATNVTSDGAVIRLLGATRASSGLYSCRVLNTIGSSDITDVASVYVEDVPEVVLDIDPLTPVRCIQLSTKCSV